jgi:alkyl sulfatase BDS1-like metallo-beta-lactamase superfamily hydrolase
MGWFDGNPANLWRHPPETAGRRYVAAIGGPDAVLAAGRRALDAGDFRWTAELVGHLVFADPGNAEARELEAAALEQLGFGAENGTWRNFYFSGAAELRGATSGTPTVTASADMIAQLTLGQLFDSVAIQIDGPKAWHQSAAVDWTVDSTPYWSRLSNGVLTHGEGTTRGDADARITVTRFGLLALLSGATTAEALNGSGDLAIEGSEGVLAILLGVLDPPDPGFAIVTP